MITITTPDGRLLATQCGQAFYTPQGSCIPAGPARWGLQDMLRLWDDMCLATGEAYVLRLNH